CTKSFAEACVGNCEHLEPRTLLSAQGTYSGILRVSGDSTAHTLTVNLASEDASGYETGELQEDFAPTFGLTAVRTGNKWTAVFAGGGGVGTLAGVVNPGVLRGRAVITES